MGLDYWWKDILRNLYEIGCLHAAYHVASMVVSGKTEGVCEYHIGHLCQDRSVFDNIEAFQDDPFFEQSLLLSNTLSSSSLNQRLDMAGAMV